MKTFPDTQQGQAEESAGLVEFLIPRKNRRAFLDRLARQVVTLGGSTVIFTILAILLVILAEVFPLFKPARVVFEGTETYSPEKIKAFQMGVDEHRTIAYIVTSGGIRFYSLKQKKPLAPVPLPDLNGARITAAARSGGNQLALGLSDGRVLPVRVSFAVSFTGSGVRRVTPSLEAQPFLTVFPRARAVTLLTTRSGSNGYSLAAATGPQTATVIVVEDRETLMGTTVHEEYKKEVFFPAKGGISALLFNGEGDVLLAGTTSGQILRVDLASGGSDPGPVDTLGATPQGEGQGVTLLGFLNGFQTLVAGTASGGVYSYQIHRGGAGRFRMQNIHSFQPHDHPVTLFDISRRDKGFITGDFHGTLQYHYGTSGKTQYVLHNPGRAALEGTVFTPKTDGILTVDGAGHLNHWSVDNPHPEISWATLFGKVIYEGYREPQYVWQSTGGTDEFEPKFSLVPLIIGTLKGTMYALLFAVPLALLGAFYTSQFMHPTYKNVVKPIVEIMAAMPSVVLGFFAALWLAPKVEKILPGLVLAPPVLVILVCLALVIYETLPGGVRNSMKPGSEIFILMAVVVLGGGLAGILGGSIETHFLDNDYRTWLMETFAIPYDQRNSLVVGIAMGFSVIPLIFTISEDSLANVPSHLTASSLALGATPWQTAWRVVLPTASPGIFSGVMIGFGRAVGETMIVLMATGNTPVMDWNIFNGFRALSANIAVELPEAPEGGTLFRILFLAAFLLFVMTFAVNTLAELVRLRLRERYRVL